MKISSLLLCVLILSGKVQAASAPDIGVVGLFPGKAVLVIDGNAPKTYSVGSNIGDGMKLVAADNETATIDVHGKRQVLTIGQYVHRAAPSSGNTVVLQADAQGHFFTKAQINGGSSLNMLVDTGASLISIPAADANKLGINYKAGQLGRSSTANGVVNVYRVRLDTVKIGDIELQQVDASVNESGLPFTLLGMSFLKRVEMVRDGERLTLTKRY
ncbi:TIGR02281 family clan AA aspartic protease [Undibacterium sp. Jales W-56]|uniref:retropepsin-like aspartic protease family protein n=1 Tax=Undibacterium sp. Jales W-56 TaxID=2897325 RepID=UPI0021D0D689|nr:TIGR02281 family clan AA aspartic protease [Undibacterium sp. Jales W-56]MCU6435517.1 TIGR02281 family clan AA aspartic protease [Undibacterium sp. Jales W-56]